MSNPFVVYDIRYPSPVTLQEIAENKIIIELWRREIHKHRITDTLKELDFNSSISSIELHPYIPSSFLDTIDKKVDLVGKSIKRWIDFYTRHKIFPSHVLRDFDDFVCDFDGSVHHGKTAKRIMICDKISNLTKFKMACECCFEDDIAHFWPSVSSQFHLRNIPFSQNKLLYYWVCRMRNHVYEYKIPIPEDDNRGNLDVSMLTLLITGGDLWSSLEYFFDRINPTRRLSHLNEFFQSIPTAFFRYIPAKLSEEELEELVTTHKAFLHWFLYNDKSSIFWTYLKRRINLNGFVDLIRNMLSNFEIYETLPEIWMSVPDHFKQSVIRRVLLDDSSSRNIGQYNEDANFFMVVLSNASFRDKNTLWKRYWVTFLRIMNTNDLHQLMSTCFGNEDEMNRFKNTVMSDYRKIRNCCNLLFTGWKFERLNEILNFCIIGEENIRRIKLQLLNGYLNIDRDFLEKADSFNKFINDAYNDVDSASKFKIQWISKPENTEEFNRCICHGGIGGFDSVKKFVETLFPSEATAKNVRKNVLLPGFKTLLTDWSDYDYDDVELALNTNFDRFLRWCLETDDEMARFKQTLDVDKIIRGAIGEDIQRLQKNDRGLNGDRDPLTYYPSLVKFLKWCFVTPEAYENFKARYADDEEFLLLTTQTE